MEIVLGLMASGSAETFYAFQKTNVNKNEFALGRALGFTTPLLQLLLKIILGFFGIVEGVVGISVHRPVAKRN